MPKKIPVLPRQPGRVSSVALAWSVIFERVESLSEADRNDLFELFREWPNAAAPDERESLWRAVAEILAQTPIAFHQIDLTEDPPMPRGLHAWAVEVGRRIREARVAAGLSQSGLAEKSGLTQSHVSRLENAEHSATPLTMEKLAKALGVQVSKLDPGGVERSG